MNQKQKTQSVDSVALNAKIKYIHQALQYVQIYYQELVCQLFQTIQQFMYGQSAKTIRRQLYYAKKILDLKIAQLAGSAMYQQKNLTQIMEQIINIFLLKLNNQIKNQMQLGPDKQFIKIALKESYQTQQKNRDPFILLEQNKVEINDKNIQIVEELITLALTKKQFRYFSSQMLVLGAFEAIKQLKGQLYQKTLNIFINQTQAQQSKAIFKNLLLSLDQL